MNEFIEWLQDEGAVEMKDKPALNMAGFKSKSFKFKGHTVDVVKGPPGEGVKDEKMQAFFQVFLQNRELGHPTTEEMKTFLEDLKVLEEEGVCSLGTLELNQEQIKSDIKYIFASYIDQLEDPEPEVLKEEKEDRDQTLAMYKRLKDECMDKIDEIMNEFKATLSRKRRRVSAISSWFHINSLLSNVLPVVDRILARKEQCTGFQ